MAMLSINEKKNLTLIIHRSYWYRFYAIIFSAAGLGLFGYLYFGYIQKDLYNAMQSPYTVFSFFVPFLPGAYLAYRAEKLQLKARAILNRQRSQT